jgi:DNA-binding NtrC family response regulator
VGESGRSVLVVEDDAALRMLCRVNLELEQFRVREADSVAGARAAIAEERPALVFLDVHLSGALSDDLLDELIEAGIPAVIVSGTIDVAQYEGRATDVLGKPFELDDLVAAAKKHAVG